MGDRGNIAIFDAWTDDLDAVVLYTHSGGTNLAVTLQRALDSKFGRGRWDDDAYLSRIIFDTMIGEARGGGTGYGITVNKLSDNEYPILVVDCKYGRVAARPEDAWRTARVRDEEGVTFTAFCEMDHVALMAFHHGAEDPRV